jgi:hypothetical protein
MSVELIQKNLGTLLVSPLAAAAVIVAGKKKKAESFSDGTDAGSLVVFIFLILLFVLLPYGIAFYMASKCTDVGLNVILAFFFPIIYIIVRLISPCKPK